MSNGLVVGCVSVTNYFRYLILFIALILLTSCGAGTDVPGTDQDNQPGYSGHEGEDSDNDSDDVDDSGITTKVTMHINLNPEEVIPPAFDDTNPVTTSNYSYCFVVYDSLLNPHVVTIYFRKSVSAPAGPTWEWFVVVGAADSSSGITEIQAYGTLDFNSSGALEDESPVTYSLPSGGFDFGGEATAGQIIDFDFGTSIFEGGTGLDGSTFRATSTVYPTTNLIAYVGLDSGEVVPNTFNVASLDTTSNRSISKTVYDSLGLDHTITIYFRKSADAPAGNTWEWFAVVDASETLVGITEIQAQGTLSFDADGVLASESIIAYPVGGFNFAGGATPGQQIVFDFGIPLSEVEMSGYTFNGSSELAYNFQFLVFALDPSLLIYINVN